MYKKLVSLLLAALLALTATAALAEGIGTPDKPVVIKFQNKDVDPTNDVIKAMEALVEQKMAEQGDYIDLVILESPAGAYAEAVPLALRTGQLEADIVYFQGGDEPVAAEGLLEDLTPYIAASKWIKNAMAPHNAARTANYPYLLWLSPATQYIPMMRKDHLEKIGMLETLKNDPTVENYHAAFKALVDQGIVKYAVSGDGTLNRLNHFFNHAFGVTSTIMQAADGKWVYSFATEAEKNKLAFYAQLYAEGLLDPEYLTMKWADVAKKFYNGEVALVAVTQGAVVYSYAQQIVQNQGEAAEAVVLPPAKGVSQNYISTSVAKETRGMSIVADSKVKDACFALFDFLASPEGRVIDKLGIEDVTYTVVDGKAVYTPAHDNYYGFLWETYANLPEDVADKTALMYQQGWDSMDLAAKYYAEDIDAVLPADLLPTYDAIRELYTQYATDIIRGVKPVDSFDEFLAQYPGIGGDQLAEYLATVLK